MGFLMGKLRSTRDEIKTSNVVPLCLFLLQSTKRHWRMHTLVSQSLVISGEHIFIYLITHPALDHP